jgi:zinc protease
MVWGSSPRYSSDEAALDILSSILSSGRGSRLQGSLIYDKQIAQDVASFNYALEAGGMFITQSTAKPGSSLDEIEKDINVEIERIKKEAPTKEEMDRAVNSIESQTIYGMQTVLGKADQMNGYATFLDKPNYFQADLDRYSKVSAADVQKAANKYLTKDRFVMSFVPRTSTAKSAAKTAANNPTSKAAKKDEKKEDYSANLPKPGSNPSFSLPSIEKTKLSNGLNVWVVKQSELP